MRRIEGIAQFGGRFDLLFSPVRRERPLGRVPREDVE